MTREEALAQVSSPGSSFEIGEVCVRGRPQRVYLNAPPTLRALFEASAEHAEREALVYEDERWSYAELHARVAALCRVLAEDAGIARGDRVAIGMRNLPEWPLAFWATQCLGAPDSVGLPNPTAGLRVVGGDGRDVAAGEVGEIWLGGPQVVRGYWNDEKATADAFNGDWFKSGDLGSIDARGMLHVVDRLKDMVIRGGENVYCAEVEARLFEHPAVADVAVVGLPHPALGEEVAAAIVPRAGAETSADAIRAFAAERLAAYKVPTRIVFRSEALPRNAVGKVLKRQLREELAAMPQAASRKPLRRAARRSRAKSGWDRAAPGPGPAGPGAQRGEAERRAGGTGPLPDRDPQDPARSEAEPSGVRVGRSVPGPGPAGPAGR